MIEPKLFQFKPDAIADFDKISELSESVISGRKLVNYEEIVADARLLALGEIHTSDRTKEEVTFHLQQLKDIGFTHLAMEAFGTHMQPAIDQYQLTGNNREILIKYLKSGLGGWSLRATDLYLQMVDVSSSVGMKVVGIDFSELEHEQYSQVGKERTNARNEKMAQTVQEILKKGPQHKIISFTGAEHASAIGSLITRNGITATTVRFFDGRHPVNTLFETSLIKAGIDQERFMLSSRFKSPNFSMPYDWIIYLP